jgi:low molecular weight protein-tyrosine phosphatase
MRILMVCLGNICRSPIAEGVMRHKIKQQGLSWTVESAGTETYHIGEAPQRFSQKVCLDHGIDVSAFRASKFTVADFENYDKIYALAKDVLREIKQIGGGAADMSKVDLIMNESHPGKNEDVPDPYQMPEAEFRKVYKMIDEACDAIINNYSKEYV